MAMQENESLRVINDEYRREIEARQKEDSKYQKLESQLKELPGNTL